MDSEDAPSGLPDLARDFHLVRVLNDEGRALYLLGEMHDRPAVLIVEAAALDAAQSRAAAFTDLKSLGNDIYTWLTANYSTAAPDVKLSLIHPATEAHIKKYSASSFRMVRETPKLWRSVVEPYIASFPPSRIQWVYNILEHKKEAERIVYEDTDSSSGFIILPDLKWDQTTMPDLYLQTIVQPRDIRCVRDLKPKHLDMLRKIRDDGERAILAKFPAVKSGDLRFFVHYPPSFYHLHVHIAHVAMTGRLGMLVGQAHLLNDVIDALELEESGPPHPSGLSWFERRTFSYALDAQHGTYDGIVSAQNAGGSPVKTE